MKPANPSPRVRRLSGDDWIDAASEAMVERGIAAVAVEPLAERLGVTKGSFYWHFASRDALLTATLERWEREETEAAIAALDQIGDSRERLEQLIVRALTENAGGDGSGTTAWRSQHAFELAVADAADDPNVQPILRRVSERRVDYLTECFRALGWPADEAERRGLLAYAVYVGVLRLAREAPERMPVGAAEAAFHRHLVATLLPDRGEERRAGIDPD